MQELLPVYASYVQCEEADSAAWIGFEHRGDDLRGSAQPPIGEANGDACSTFETTSISHQILKI